MKITHSGNRFILEGKSLAYVIDISPKRKVPVHVYFGPKKESYSASDVPPLNIKLLNENGQLEDTDGVYDGETPVEAGSYLRFDFRPAAVILERDGVKMTDFRYDSWSEDAPQYPSYWPKPRHLEGAKWFCLHLREISSGVELRLYYCLLDDQDILLRADEVVGTIPLHVRKLSSLSLDFLPSDYLLEHFPGDWAKERQDEKVFPIPTGTLTITSQEGRAGHRENPYFALHRAGEHYGFNLIYSGGVTNEVNRSPLGGTRVNVYFGGDHLDYALKKGESFLSPISVVSFAKTEDDLIHLNHDFVREHILPPSAYPDGEPLVFNSFDGAGFDLSTEKMLYYADEAAALGTDIFVLDDGWFSTRDDDGHGLGDWRVNEKKIDLVKLAKRCQEDGMEFGIWIEPEAVNPDVPIFQKDHNVVLGLKKELLFTRQELALDWSYRPIVDEIYSQLEKSFSGVPIAYFKMDLNRVLLDVSSSHTPEGEVWVKYADNLYYFLDRLIRDFKPKLFESCASGGARFDLGQLYYGRRSWASDNTTPHGRTYVQAGTAKGYPLVAMSSHVANSETMQERCAVAYFDTYGYEFDPKKLSQKDKEIGATYLDLYRRYHKKTVEDGDYYELASPFESDRYFVECVSKDKKTAVALFYVLTHESSKNAYVRLKGLDPDKAYLAQGKEYKGSYLMEQGFLLPEERDHESPLFVAFEEKE